MFKILFPLFVLIVTFSYATEDSYVFEAKGEFAKELKALVEKYSKEGKIDAKVYKKDDSIISSILNKDNYEVDGKALYLNKCASCHGVHGEVGAGAGSRLLKEMSKDDMIFSIYAYQNDEHYGGSMKSLMQNNVIGLNEKKIESIYSYLHKIDKKLKNSIQNKEKNEAIKSYLQ